MAEKDLQKIRHSAAHILAAAVKELYPKAKLGMGPATEDGFYYDFDNLDITEKDLHKIEKKAKELIKKNLKFEREEITFAKAEKLFAKEKYKKELIKDYKKEKKKLSVYRCGDFIDLCEGPHVRYSKEVKGFKLLKLAGAYWKGSEKNKMLVRIYGVAFPTGKELENYMEILKNAEENNHIKLGKELKLFAVDKLIGKGLPSLLPYGATIRRELERFIVDEELKRGYKHVYSHVLGNIDLYKTSGHWQHYGDDMYAPLDIEGKKYILRPMCCPHHFMIYKEEPKSYRDLPLRLAELGQLYRYEMSGALQGLQRVRGFVLADSHIFCTKEQVKDEAKGALDLAMFCLKTLGIKDYWFRLSLRDKADKVKYASEEANWSYAEKILKQALKEMKLKYVEQKGEAAFYGPKIDIQIKNVWGKEDTIITVQVDFFLPKRFNLKYIDKDNEMKMPIVVHRSSIGAIERTMAFLIERYKGAFPVWLAPVQVKLINFTDDFLDYAKKVEKKLIRAGIRVESDYKSSSVQYRIREAELMRIPYILVVGEKEKKSGTVAVRTRGSKKVEFGVKADKFINKVLKETTERKLVP